MTAGARIDADDLWFCGEDKALRFVVRDDTGAQLNATGWHARWQLFPRRARAGATALITRDVVGEGGVIVVKVPAEMTAVLPGGTYEHVLRRTDGEAFAVLAHDTVELGAVP